MRANDRRASGHGFQDRQTKTFIEGGKSQYRRVCNQFPFILARHLSGLAVDCGGYEPKALGVREAQEDALAGGAGGEGHVRGDGVGLAAGGEGDVAEESGEALDAEARGLSEEQNTLALSFREAETSFAVAVEEKEREERFLKDEEARLLALETKLRDLTREANELKVRLAEERGER